MGRFVAILSSWVSFGSLLALAAQPALGSADTAPCDAGWLSKDYWPAPSSAEGFPRYISTADLLSKALGRSDRPSMLVRSTDELRYLPLAVQGMDLFLVVSSDLALNHDRTQAVTAVARRQGIHIFLVWTHPKSDPPPLLLKVVEGTGGKALRLEGSCTPLAQQSPV